MKTYWLIGWFQFHHKHINIMWRRSGCVCFAFSSPYAAQKEEMTEGGGVQRLGVRGHTQSLCECESFITIWISMWRVPLHNENFILHLPANWVDGRVHTLFHCWANSQRKESQILTKHVWLNLIFSCFYLNYNKFVRGKKSVNFTCSNYSYTGLIQRKDKLNRELTEHLPF